MELLGITFTIEEKNNTIQFELKDRKTKPIPIPGEITPQWCEDVAKALVKHGYIEAQKALVFRDELLKELTKKSEAEFLEEEELYELVAAYFLEQGYMPVKVNSVAAVKDARYRPDVVGLNGMKVVGVEVEAYFDEYKILEATTQAKIYQRGCTHVYVAFPQKEYEKASKEDAETKKFDRLRSIVDRICEESGIGILLIDTKTRKSKLKREACFSQRLDLEDYGYVMEQLRGEARALIYNTRPFLIRDLCVILLSREGLKKDELLKELRSSLPDNHWLIGSRGSTVESRIRNTLETAESMGLVKVSDENECTLSHAGRYLVTIGKQNFSKSELVESERVFFNSYLINHPLVQYALDLLEQSGKPTPLYRGDNPLWDQLKIKTKESWEWYTLSFIEETQLLKTDKSQRRKIAIYPFDLNKNREITTP
jgi:hypothetical protein